jgi:hypothetical protein
MGTRVTTKDEYNRKYEFFYKKVNKQIGIIPMSRKIVECRLDVDIKNISDIEKIRVFLNNLETSMKS